MRRIDQVTAFVVTLALHAVIAVGAEWLSSLKRVPLRPEFAEGLSSVELMLVPSRPVAPEPVPEPVEEPVVEEEPVAEPEEQLVELIRDPVPVVEQEEETTEVVEDVVKESDADILDKGVTAELAAVGEIRPRYPFGSRLRGEEGVVSLRLVVNAGGRCEGVEITESSGYSALDKAAVSAVMRASFAAADGRADRSGKLALSFRFELVD